jgi:short subunit dehydrogenase-like uncharacterized protein
MDAGSMAQLATQTRVVCTTVGPYARLGAELVRACAEHGTHYCDLAGEITFMRRMIDLHDETARSTGARIVHCCGFDAIPSDLGVMMLQDAMKKRHGIACKTIKVFLTDSSGGVSGGTIESGFGELEAMHRDPSVRRLLEDPYALSPMSPARAASIRHRPGVYFEVELGSWVARSPFAHINARVVRRTNALLGFPYGTEFRYTEAAGTGRGLAGYVKAIGIEAGLGAYRSLARLPVASRLVRRTFLPKPGQGPSAERRQRGHFTLMMIGKGTLPDGSAVVLRARVAGTSDPGYGETAKMLAESAVCLTNDDARKPGGIHTPGSALGLTLIERLRSAGMTFEVL